MKQFRRYLNILAMLLLSVNLIGQDYCTPNFDNERFSTTTYISSVIIGDYTNETSSGDSEDSYEDYSNNDQNDPVASFKLEETFNIKVVVGGSTNRTRYCGLHIDFNRDGDFNELAEYVSSEYSNTW